MRPLLALALLVGSAVGLNDYWGHFCGNHDCYEVLGLSRDATLKDVKRAYRTESLKNHPDKVAKQKKKEANAKFQVLAKAYNVLSNETKREEYDYYVEHPHEYWAKYGHAFFTTFAPKSNTVVVLLVLLSFISFVTYASQHTKYNEALNTITAAIVRGKNSREMMAIKRDGVEMRDAKLAAEGKERSKRAKIKDEDDPLLFACVREIVAKSHIEGARKPEWRDFFVIYLACVCLDFGKWVGFQIKWQYRRRVLRLPLSEEETKYLVKKQLGKGGWEQINEEDQKSLIKGEVTVEELMQEYKEAEEKRQQKGMRRRRRDRDSDNDE